MRYWPQSLLARVAWIVGGGLALAHCFTLLIIVRERGDLGLTLMTSYLGRDVAASVAILERVPAAERPAWLPALSRSSYRYLLQAAPSTAQPSHNRLAQPLTTSVSQQLGKQVIGPMSEAATASQTTMYLPLRLHDGSLLTVALTPPSPSISGVSVTLLMLQLSALSVAGWFAVRLVVRPVSQLARAADAITDGATPPLNDLQGPLEVRQAMRAFQAMQSRISHQLSERLHLLAAISHDLQTPITRMRLRAEQIECAPLRERMLADMQAMQRLVDEGLAYAKTAHASQEPLRTIDLHALLDGLVCDAADTGADVRLLEPVPATLTTRVQALSRVLTNLLDNAMAFGTRIEVQAVATQVGLTLTVLDNGPGIPPEDLAQVFDPFFRVEGSRNRATGGTGLGLAIASQLSLALQGTLTLRNRPEGGLAASLTVPVTAPIEPAHKV